MAKIAIAKGTIVVLILVVVLVAGGVSAGVSLMSVSPEGLKRDKSDTGATGATGAAGATGATGPAGLGVTPGSLVTPAYDSGWVNITTTAGQNIVLNLVVLFFRF